MICPMIYANFVNLTCPSRDTMQNQENSIYMISEISQMLDIHPQTLRQYERNGLISPSRSKGKVRLYSYQDLQKMRLILQLIRDYGINVAGVEMILQLKEYERSMQKEIKSLRDGLSNIGEKGIRIEQSISSCKQDMNISIKWCY